MLQNRVATLTGLGIGASLMYYLDPERGRRRRALVRDKLAHAASIGAVAIATTGRDLTHRATGAVARFRGMLRNESIDDVVLVERVRAQLGRCVSHPHDIDVDATGGRVRLRGHVPQAEQRGLLEALERVRGVREVVLAFDERIEAGSARVRKGRWRRRQIEDVSGSGVYPASGPLPSGNALLRTPAELGHPAQRGGMRATDVAAAASGVLMVAGGISLLAWARPRVFEDPTSRDPSAH